MELIVLLAVLGLGAYLGFRSLLKTDKKTALASKHAESALASVPDWVRAFILYHVAEEMRLGGQGNLPNSIRALALGKLDAEQELALLASLRSYLSYAYGRQPQPGDTGLVISEARDFLQAELRTLNSPTATRRYIRRTHKKETGYDITEPELEVKFTEIFNGVQQNQEAGNKLRNLLLADSLFEQFLIKHKKQIDVFAFEMAEHVQAAT